jgi:hypothetical protein
MDDAAKALLDDVDSNVRQSAIWAAKARPALTSALVKGLAVEPNNWIRADLANALADCEPRQHSNPFAVLGCVPGTQRT